MSATAPEPEAKAPTAASARPATAPTSVGAPAGMTGSLTTTRGLLRFSTAGSVDDGKSTLIGRLLYDSQAVFEDQLASVRKSKINRAGGPHRFFAAHRRAARRARAGHYH